jgi:dCMP deaminase
VTSRPSRPAARRARRAAPNADAAESHPTKEQARPDKASYAMILAFAAALRSTCLSRKVGCVIVRDGQVIATGYNGTPKGTWHPEEFPRPCPCVGGISGADLSLKYCAHGEANALAQSAYRGSSTAGADIFCTNFPCIECVKLLISAGIRAIYYVHGYPDLSGLRDRYLSQAGIPTHPIAWSRIQPHLAALAKG